jgi:hypothetical protein
MGTQRSWVLNMYDTDFGPVRIDVYANFNQQLLSKEAGCKKYTDMEGGNGYNDGVSVHVQNPVPPILVSDGHVVNLRSLG